MCTHTHTHTHFSSRTCRAWLCLCCVCVCHVLIRFSYGRLSDVHFGLRINHELQFSESPTSRLPINPRKLHCVIHWTVPEMKRVCAQARCASLEETACSCPVVRRPVAVALEAKHVKVTQLCADRAKRPFTSGHFNIIRLSPRDRVPYRSDVSLG
jgi:hypothetical protein